MRKDSLALLRPDHCCACGEPFTGGPPQEGRMQTYVTSDHDREARIPIHNGFRCADRWQRHLRRTHRLDSKVRTGVSLMVYMGL
jgi:hypothetical protein